MKLLEGDYQGLGLRVNSQCDFALEGGADGVAERAHDGEDLFDVAPFGPEEGNEFVHRGVHSSPQSDVISDVGPQ